MAMSSFTNRRTFIKAITAALFPGAVLGYDRKDPVDARNGTAEITLSALEPIEPGGWLLARFRFPPRSAPLLGPEAVTAGHRLLMQLHFEGRAAGNYNDLYDNLDRGHSELPAAAHPQLTHIIYDADARNAGLDYGAPLKILFNVPVIGNSSTALTSGPFWRSQPRHMLTLADGPQRLARIYSSGALRIFPEHRDHDPEHGDLLPANTPYYIISQGSSGSDQPHLEALAMILAAFQPETKEMLKRTGLISSTLQMVYRRARLGIINRAAYLSGRAHPTVFDAKGINLAHMVSLANALTPDDVPPMVVLDVEHETEAVAGIDFFGDGLSERLFDTPSAIARVWRSKSGRREMVVSAQSTRDPNGRPLHFTWSLLHGDPARTRIEPLDEYGSRARISVDWQNPRTVPGHPDITSPRVDIGVFANNAVHDSAPAFVSFLMPTHERRVYEPGPDGGPRPVSIDRWTSDRYADPALFPQTAWRDEYRYGSAGQPKGWYRTADDENLKFDAKGRFFGPEGPVLVRYPIERATSSFVKVKMHFAEE